MTNEVLTRQEMFNRAWNGLKAQNWEPALNGIDCVYQTKDGKRCAWGHVDTSLTARVAGSVYTLRSRGIGLAAKLNNEDAKFAQDLQRAHDACVGVMAPLALGMMEANFRHFAKSYGLTIPGE